MTSIPLLKDENHPFETYFWRIRKIGFIIILLLVCAALLGFAGHGWMSERKASNKAITVQYEYFLRNTSPAQMTIIPKLANGKHEIMITFSSSLIDVYQVQRIEPSPLATRVDNQAITYIFATGENTAQTPITFYFQPQKIGRINGSITSANETIAISQFSYP